MAAIIYKKVKQQINCIVGLVACSPENKTSAIIMVAASESGCPYRWDIKQTWGLWSLKWVHYDHRPSQRGRKKQVVNQSMSNNRHRRHLFLAKARSLQSTHDIFATIYQHCNKWRPAGHTVQAPLAGHRTVIETFISPLVVREGMSINGAYFHHWNFGETTAALGSFPCRGQVRFAKVSAGWKLNEKHYFSFWHYNWAGSPCFLLIYKLIDPNRGLYNQV